MVYQAIERDENEPMDWKNGTKRGEISPEAVEKISENRERIAKLNKQELELYNSVRVQMDTLHREADNLYYDGVLQVIADEFGAEGYWDVEVSKYFDCKFSPVGACVYVSLDDHYNHDGMLICRFCGLPDERGK